ncbi:CarD family transcriptional regulator [Clostridioides difficile]
MFNIGDKIVYPSQGIGVIDSIEKREFKGEKQDYYNIEIINSSMKLSLPISRVEDTNIRLVSNSKDIDSDLSNFGDFVADSEEIKNVTAKERMIINNKKLKEGKVNNYLDVICNLTQVMKYGNININEKQILKATKSLVVEEISQSKDLSKEEATELLEKSIKF